MLIGNVGAAGHGPADGQPHRHLGIVEKSERQLRHIMLLHLEVGGLQDRADDERMGRNNRRGDADDSHRHVEMPALKIGALQLDGEAILHVMRRSRHGLDGARAFGQLRVRRDGSDDEALPLAQGRELGRRRRPRQ